MSAPATSRGVPTGSRLLAGASVRVTRAVEQAWAHTLPADPKLVRDAMNGLLAFIVPGNDDYSVQQGVSVESLGGVDAGSAESLIAMLDAAAPQVPHFSAVVATLLDGVARAVDPLASGPFVSAFACLSFARKATVLRVMESNEAYEVFAAVLPGFVAFFVYSEAGAFDPAIRSITGTPLGWRVSGEEGGAGAAALPAREPASR